jgi:1,4-dihydroxy-2-naphthoate octaprenyltransferase
MENDSLFSQFWKILRPGKLGLMVGTYLLGISLVHYLGGDLNLAKLFIGLLLTMLIYELNPFLSAYFDHPESVYSRLERSDPDWEMLIKIKRPLLLQVSLVLLASVALLTLLLVWNQNLTAAGVLLITLSLLLNLFPLVAAFRVNQNLYRHLIEAIYIANLVPAMAFAILDGSVSPLLVELTLPLTLLFLAMCLALDLAEYGFDTMHGRQSLITGIGWQRGIRLHNLLVLGTFVLAGIFTVTAFIWSITWPMFLSLPIGVLQILEVQRIGEGARPIWKLLKWGAIGFFLMVVYLLIISLWL